MASYLSKGEFIIVWGNSNLSLRERSIGLSPLNKQLLGLNKQLKDYTPSISVKMTHALEAGHHCTGQ